MSLQFKNLALTSATFLNGAYLDIDRIKSCAIIKAGTKYGTGSAVDGGFNKPFYMWVGEVNGSFQLWVMDMMNSRLERFYVDRNTGVATFKDKILLPAYAMGLVVDTENGEYWVTTWSSAVPSTYDLVYRYSLADDTLINSFYTGNGSYPAPLIAVYGDYVYLLDNADYGKIYKYDKLGNLIDTISPDYTPVGGWDGAPTNFEFDGTNFYVSIGRGLFAFVPCKIDLTGVVTPIINTYDYFTGVLRHYAKGYQIATYKGNDICIIRDYHFNIIYEYNCTTGEANLIASTGLNDGQLHNTGYDDYNEYRGGSVHYRGDYLLVAHSKGYLEGYCARFDQTALWSNQSLGNAGTINQITVKQSGNGVKNWYIKKSTDTVWQSFEPNKNYTTPLLDLSASETFDVKVEMGNFYDADKSQIEIEEVNVIYTPAITLPEITNLRITNETLTVSLAWDCSASIDFVVQESKATIGEWVDLTTTIYKSATFVYSSPEQQQIPHYFRVVGKLANGFTQPSNVVVAYPNENGQENIYKYCENQLLSILSNDSRLADVQEWLSFTPEKTTIKHKIVAWVAYKGEGFNDWVALGEREIHLNFEIGVIVKEVSRKDRFNSLKKPERKDYLFLIKEILYEVNNRTLNDYIYDLEISEYLPYRRKDNHSVGIINVRLKKRIRR